MTKKSFVPPNSGDLSWLTERGNVEKPIDVASVVNDSKHSSKANVSEKAHLATKSSLANLASVTLETDDSIITHFNIPANKAFVARLYSEVYHDPDHRPLYQVLQEIFEAGLKDRPYKGPASDTFIAQQKKRGLRKKT